MDVRFVDKDHVWIDSKQYISLTRVNMLLSEQKEEIESANAYKLYRPKSDVNKETSSISIEEKFKKYENISNALYEGFDYTSELMAWREREIKKCNEILNRVNACWTINENTMTLRIKIRDVTYPLTGHEKHRITDFVHLYRKGVEVIFEEG